ncbi:hypothetical protein ACHAXR_006759, partial [Thalassiosira sp. AJA248-18]
MDLPSQGKATITTTTKNENNDSSLFEFTGKILRKKNISTDYLKLAILEDGNDRSTNVYIPRMEPAICTPTDFHYLYIDAIIHVQGCINIESVTESYHHVTQCNLIKCAPNIKMIKEILALPNYLSFASTLGMDKDEFQSMVEGNRTKVVVHSIIEKITGGPTKAPPRYRPCRIKRSDMEILEHKEAEGQDELNHSWRLRQPCQSLDDTIYSFHDKKESVGKTESVVKNLPEGADDVVSAHHKMTRLEYLEKKKNNQTIWFVERIRQLPKLPTRILDVGGGRGDLAVHIAIHFPEVQVIVVDSNERSVLAGRDYAAKVNVHDRIEFCCMNFSDYMEEYEAAGDAGGNGVVDFVVALHACGDLSDMALSFAASNDCNFIICPCCYPKRYLAPFVPHWHHFCKEKEIDSLSRLVELDDHREVSRRA